MFSSLRNTRSIAARLVLLFTFASALLVASSLGIFYWLVVRHTFEEDNAALGDKVAALAEDVRQSGPAKALAAELQTARAGEDSPYWVRVIDSGGHVLAERSAMGDHLPANAFPPPTSPNSETAHPVNLRAGSALFSLTTAAIPTNGDHYVLQVAQDRTADDNFNRQTGLLFLVMLAASVAASALIARTTTKRGLRPLDQMSDAFQRIGPTRLDQRVGQVTWPRELQPLAAAFDQMLARLEESFTRLSRFSADLAHELRTPIANILGEAQVALTRDRTAVEYREVIESSVAECERLSRITDNLLFLARAESAREQIKRAKFDGRAVIENVASFYQTIAEERQISVECQGEGEVDADPLLFTRAVSNLVDNAMRLTPAGGTITISITSQDDAAEVSVRDNGCGIPPEHVTRVFDRFYTADPSRNSGGAGLGLALVKSIADLHGGSAALQTELSRGTTVTVRFPTESSTAEKVSGSVDSDPRSPSS